MICMMAACGVHMVEFCLNYDIVRFLIHKKQPWDFGYAFTLAFNSTSLRSAAKACTFAAFAIRDAVYICHGQGGGGCAPE